MLTDPEVLARLDARRRRLVDSRRGRRRRRLIRAAPTTVGVVAELHDLTALEQGALVRRRRDHRRSS